MLQIRASAIRKIERCGLLVKDAAPSIVTSVLGKEEEHEKFALRKAPKIKKTGLRCGGRGKRDKSQPCCLLLEF
jgi:hypothetical protein